jgi:serine/threonine protein kinase
MTWISDAAVGHLRDVADWPDFNGSRYHIVEVIGRGGMGTVFRGRDRELQRDVAIKVAAWPGAREQERLRQEARVLASLEHPGIVAVHESGRLPDGRAFYVMTLVGGQRLHDSVRHLTSLADRLRLFDRICDIVAFAHARGVIHRDLKPANIMVGAYGEVRVVDWGLARRTAPSASDADVPMIDGATASGTEGYMAPEQAVGRVDARSDVYSLGAVLRDLMVGQTTVPSRRLRPLCSIVRRATSQAPEARYSDVTALSADVRRFADGARVDAYQENVAERTARLIRTYRTPLALVLGYLLMRLLLILWTR